MNILIRRPFWTNLASACIVAIVAAVPILMSDVMDRGFEIAKQYVTEPLAVLAFGAALLAGGWRWLMQQGIVTKIAAGALLLFLGLAVVSSGLSENTDVAIFGGYYRHEGLLAWGVYGAFFFAALAGVRHPNRVVSVLDVLLLASVIPALYTIQQRVGLDFEALGTRELARPGSTLGNPVFLAAYLGLLLPVTVARCWLSRYRAPELALWLIVIMLQACGLLLTQSRGPLLAVIIGLFLLACLIAVYVHNGRIVLHVAAVFAALIATMLLAINAIPAAKHWAQEVPVFSRLVFNLDSDAAAETQSASSSAASRVAIWGAGVDTFAAAPLQKKIFGYGPESAYIHYFSHMPASIPRLVGYGADHTFDRMHADALDIGLNFGPLAWLAYCLFFGSVVYVGMRAVFGLSGNVPRWLFLGFALLGGSFAAGLAVQLGLGNAAVPAFGLGVGAGWVLFAIGCAWRALKRGHAQVSAQVTERWILLAGLTASLCVFWMDAQVNIPVVTTRLISFAFAALILIIADGVAPAMEKNADPAAATDDGLLVWGIACSMVAACASFLPVALFNVAGVQEEARWGLRALPLILFVPIAALAVWTHARRCGSFSAGAVRYWLAIAVGVPLIYVAAHFALMVLPSSELSMNHVQRITLASFACPLFIFVLCVAYATLTREGCARRSDANGFSIPARIGICFLAASVLLVAILAWRTTQADVASSLALRASEKQPRLSVQLIEEAVRLLPYERYYRRQLVFNLLDRALADIHEIDKDKVPDRIPDVVRNLLDAETAARTAALLFPLDPWMHAALANVRQVQALRVLRPLDPDGGLLAAQEANRLFAYAHLMFPTEPLLLRNWAQLLFDQGNTPDAYRLLDLMEKLIPHDLVPYSERIEMALQANDKYAIVETLARARLALEPQLFSELQRIADVRQ